jgi:adenylate cyclase
MEIERKFRVTELPDLAQSEGEPIEQGYLALADDDGGAEVRLRRKPDHLCLTVKAGSGRSRAEEEIELEPERFEALWPLTDGRRLAKTRYRLPHGELEIELDVYAGDLDGLAVAEVEFEDEPAADAFEPPAWFDDEVTGERRYLNETLATEGRPR